MKLQALKNGLGVGALCLAMGFGAAPAAAQQTLQQLIDTQAIITVSGATFDFDQSVFGPPGTLDPAFASLITVNPYTNGRLIGLSFALNSPTPLTGTVLNPLNITEFGFSIDFVGAPGFINAATVFIDPNAPLVPALGDPTALGPDFFLASQVFDSLSASIAPLFLNIDPITGISDSGLVPIVDVNTGLPVTTILATKLDFALTFGEISQVTWIQAFAVPEPGSLALIGLGLAGLAALRRRKGLAASV